VGALARIKERGVRTVASARARWPLIDHAFRTKERYAEAFGARLAAAIAYFGFFAIFAFGVVLFSILGFLVEYHVDLRDEVDQFLQENLPVVDSGQIAAGRGAAGVFALIGQVEQAPGSVILRRLRDLAVLVGLALLLGASFAVVAGIEAVVAALAQPVAWILRPLGWLLLAGVNLILALALLAALPRLRPNPRRLLPPAITVAVALVILNTLGQVYVQRVQENPAYAVVATAAGLLVYLYLVHQIVLYAAAWIATDDRGQVRDLATKQTFSGRS
jgi:membrane protein